MLPVVVLPVVPVVVVAEAVLLVVPAVEAVAVPDENKERQSVVFCVS